MSNFSRDFIGYYENPNHRKFTIVSSINESVLSNRFGTRSNNMFFVRHAAHPKSLKFLTGIDGTMICSIKDDNYTLPDDMKKALRNSLHETVDIQASNEKNEKFMFPKTFSEPNGPFETNLKWSREIENLGKKIGIMSIDEINNETNKLNLLKRLVDQNATKPINLNAKYNLNKNNRFDKNNDKKLESQSLFMMKPTTKQNDQNDSFESNSLILPKIKAIRLNHPDKKKTFDKLFKIKNSVNENQTNQESKNLFK